MLAVYIFTFLVDEVKYSMYFWRTILKQYPPQGCHLYCTQPGTTEESPNASETEHVSNLILRLCIKYAITQRVWICWDLFVPFCSFRSLIEQLRKLQALVKMSTLKASTTSTCVMVIGITDNPNDYLYFLLFLLWYSSVIVLTLSVKFFTMLQYFFPHGLLGFALQVFLLSFCLIIFPSVNPFGSRTEQKELYTPSSSKFSPYKKVCIFLTFLAISFCYI